MSTMAHAHALDGRNPLGERLHVAGRFPHGHMPAFVPIADRETGFVTWQPYSKVLKKDIMMSQEDAEQFAIDLDQLIADCRPRKEIDFQLQAPEQELGSSHPRLSKETLISSSPEPIHKVSTKSINMREPLHETRPASNDHRPPYNTVMRARGISDTLDLSRDPKKPQEKAVRKEMNLASNLHNKGWKTMKSILDRQGGKHLTPNQRYQAVVAEYFGNPTKLARLEDFFQSLPSEKSDLEHTTYAQASPYEQLFVYSRLTKPAHHHRQSYEEVYRKFLSMRLELEVEINQDLLQAMVTAGIPLSEENAAKLQLWTEENQFREAHKALKGRGRAVHDLLETYRGEPAGRLLGSTGKETARRLQAMMEAQSKPQKGEDFIKF
jgi:hypothetical protein